MTIDKIKHYMNPIVFNYWISLVINEKEAQFYIDKALNTITEDINLGLLKGVEFVAEKNLLIILGGKNNQ